ncbi:YSIRK-type signal peptide-containing protein, partial [Lactobacillus alvi]
MLGKNNQKLYDQQHADQHQHWALRKLSLGVASVLVSVSIYAGASTISANADTQTSGATGTTALTNGSSASSLGSASSVAQSASSATTNKSAANNASATQQNRSARATSSSTQGTTTDYTPKVTTSLPSDYPSQFNNDTYSEYFVFKEVKDELNDVSYYGAVKQDGSESGTVYIFAQSADGTISGPIKLASGESKSQNGITSNNYGNTYTVYENNNRNNNNLYYGYSSDGEKDSANRSQGYNVITGVLPTNGQFALTINYYDKAGKLVKTKLDPQTVLAGKYIEVSAPEVVNGYVLTKTKGNQSGEVSEYTADKVGQTWTRHFTYTGLDADYTLNSGGSFTVKVYKNSQLVKTMTVPVDGTGQYQEINGGYRDTYAFPNPYIAGATSLTYNYTQVGSIVPVDKDGNKIGDEVPYTNDSEDPRKVESNEPVPKIPGYTPETPTVTPSDPRTDTQVVYNKQDGSLTVKYVDQDSNNAVLETKDLSGKYGDKITYTTTDTIKSLEAKGYVLVSDDFTGKVGSEFDDANNGKIYLVVLKHGTTTVTPEDPKDPNTPINPNDPDSPKYTEDQTKVNVPSTQTITYTGAGDKTPAKDVQTGEFDRTVTIDKVTGETISSTPWTYTVNGKTTTGESLTYGTKDTPVVDGYHADKKVAGGLTATVDNPNVEDTVTYTENGKIIPVDPDGNKIPNVPNPTYPTDPTDPTKVTPDEPVPKIPGYTPETPTVTPSDPGKDTQVVYNKQDGSLTVKYVDQDSNNAVLETKDLSGKYGDKITYTTTDTIKSLEAKGYVLVSDGFTGKVGSEFDDANNGKIYLVVLKHGTTTVTP